jgi:hypothetical protein
MLARFVGELFFNGPRSYHEKLQLGTPSVPLLAWCTALLATLLDERLESLEAACEGRPTRDKQNCDRTSLRVPYDHHLESIQTKTARGRAGGGEWLKEMWKRLVDNGGAEKTGTRAQGEKILYLSDPETDDEDEGNEGS